MRLKNHSDISDEKIKEIIRSVKPYGVSKVNVTIHNCRSSFSGHHTRAGEYRHIKTPNGTIIHEGFHKDTQIVASITRNENEFPLYIDNRKGGYLPCLLLSREEALVYVLAHELRHAWQTNHKRGRVWRSKGKYSERDADSYAIRIVREWRREKQIAAVHFPYEQARCLFSLQYQGAEQQ